MEGGPSACHDRTVRATHLNCQTVFSDLTDTLSQHIRAAPIKSYDPNFLYKSPYGLKLTPQSTPREEKSQKNYKNGMHARPTSFSIKIFKFLENLKISHARTTLGVFRL